MLAIKEKLPRYADMRRGEDTVHMDACRAAGLKIHLLDRPDLYVYVVHGQNTYPEEHFERHIFNEDTGILTAAEAAEVRTRLEIPVVADKGIASGRIRPGVANRTSIAVVIPCHGQKHLLVRALGSVLWQLGPDDEVIVVNDCGEDWRLGELVGPEPERVMWLHHHTRRGVAASRNTAIRRAKAEWIKFLDADDVLAPFALDALRRADDLPKSIHILAGGCHRVVDGRYHDYLSDSDQSLGRILEANPLLPSAVFARRSALVEVGLFDERFDFEEDWDLWLRLHERYGLEAFAVVDRPLCYYWINEAERRKKVRNGTVDGVPVRDYFRQRYGAKPR
jgi:cellulose synthase/poly-beta-1,6-N-acetylglucosamine synthase-like glycosyltransferase